MGAKVGRMTCSSSFAQRNLKQAPQLAGRRRGAMQVRMSAYSSSHTLNAEALAAGPPVIDMAPLFSQDPKAQDRKQEVINEIAKAAAQWGFFQVRTRTPYADGSSPAPP